MNNSKEVRNSVAAVSSPNQIVYKYFADKSFDGFFSKKNHSIIAVGKRGQSLSFISSSLDPYRILQKTFGFEFPARTYPKKNVSLFKSRYLEAVNGGGYEIGEITHLNSSSLAALLCFYGVNDSNPLRINIEGQSLLFTSVILEKENPVYASNRPSSIDVALYGINENTKKKVVLFLESKFGEYLSPKDVKSESGKSYASDYSRVSAKAKKDGLLKDIEFYAGDNGSFIKGDGHYCEGLKQMISHYVGAKNSYELNQEKRGVYLGSILFDFQKIVPEAKTKIDDYRNVYCELSKILNMMAKEDNISVTICNEIFTYQTLFNGFCLDEDVKQFYQL